MTTVAAGAETDNAQTNTKNVADAVGNSGTAGPVGGNKVDKKAPTFLCAAAPSSWSQTDVTIACTGADGGSGLDPASDSSFSLVTTVAAGAETANASTGTKTLTDGVGHTTTAPSISGIKVDKKAPSLIRRRSDGITERGRLVQDRGFEFVHRE